MGINGLTGQDTKYGQIETEYPNNIAEDEPLFLIRAKDAISAQAIWAYLDLYHKATAGATLSNEQRMFEEKIEAAARAFEEWQKKNTTKIPD